MHPVSRQQQSHHRRKPQEHTNSAATVTSPVAAPITRNLELEALQEAVRWPNATPQTVLALVDQLLAARRDQEGLDYFRERAAAQPHLFQRVAVPGICVA